MDKGKICTLDSMLSFLYLLSTYYIPQSLQSSGNKAENKNRHSFCLYVTYSPNGNEHELLALTVLDSETHVVFK